MKKIVLPLILLVIFSACEPGIESKADFIVKVLSLNQQSLDIHKSIYNPNTSDRVFLNTRLLSFKSQAEELTPLTSYPLSDTLKRRIISVFSTDIMYNTMLDSLKNTEPYNLTLTISSQISMKNKSQIMDLASDELKKLKAKE